MASRSQKANARVDLWLKNVAPSTELRKWFNHDPERWEEFKQRYFDELSDATEAIEAIRLKIKDGAVTFVFGSEEQRFNNAVALREYIDAGA